MSRMVAMFGQYGAAADPVNFPRFVERVQQAGVEVLLCQHYDSQKAYSFLHGYKGRIALVGASLGAMSVVVCAGYLTPQPVHFVGGFQPSDYDPSGHSVNIPLKNASGEVYDVITRAIELPRNVLSALCFRNPQAALTAGLGHAAYIERGDGRLQTIERLDVHPGDFGEAQDVMVERVLGALK